MSAPTSHDPLVVNTRDGMCWKRQHVDGDGRGLYALADVTACPAYVLSSFGELAERGIVGSADVLPVPVPVGPQTGDQGAYEKRLREQHDLDVATINQLRARIAELEALTPARVQTCRVCGAGYTYGQRCTTCEFKARMASELQARGLDGEHYGLVHHDWRLGRDLPQAGGSQ